MRKASEKLIDSVPFFLLFSLIFSIYVLVNYRLSQEIGVFLVTYSLTTAIAYFPSRKLVNWLYDQRFVYLLELRAVDEGIGFYKFPLELWQEVNVVKGSLFVPDTSEEVRVCQYFDKTELVVEGTWRGSCCDLELLRNIEKIKEIRDSLEEMAQRGLATRTRLKSLVRGSINRIGREMAKEAEEELLFSGEEIKEVVEEEMEKSGIYD